MTRAGRKTDAATTLLMVLLILTAAKLLLERLLALMLPHDLHQIRACCCQWRRKRCWLDFQRC